MAQKVFQIAKDLCVDSRIIVGKLVQENLPPPGSDPSENSWQESWTPRSPVSVGLREMIREWHTSGELMQAALTAKDAGRPRRRGNTSTGRAGVPSGDLTASGLGREMVITDDNSAAQRALAAIAQIDQETHQKKLAQQQKLQESRITIVEEIRDLFRQLGQIDKVLGAIADRPATQPSGEPTGRRDLGPLRERMGAWLEGRRGEKFGAAALAKEFPELGNTAVSYVLKPLVAAGRIQTDTSAGSKRPKYFAS